MSKPHPPHPHTYSHTQSVDMHSPARRRPTETTLISPLSQTPRIPQYDVQIRQNNSSDQPASNSTPIRADRRQPVLTRITIVSHSHR